MAEQSALTGNWITSLLQGLEIAIDGFPRGVEPGGELVDSGQTALQQNSQFRQDADHLGVPSFGRLHGHFGRSLCALWRLFSVAALIQYRRGIGRGEMSLTVSPPPQTTLPVRPESTHPFGGAPTGSA